MDSGQTLSLATERNTFKELRRDSNEIERARLSKTSLQSKFKEIKRKTSVGKRSLPKTTGQELHDLFYAPSRPSPKSLEFYQNRPRSAVSVMNSSHERTNSNSSQTSNQSNSKKIFASLEDCKRTVITMGANGKVGLNSTTPSTLNQMRCWPFKDRENAKNSSSIRTLEELQARISLLEGENAQLQRKVTEKDRIIENLNTNHKNELKAREVTIQRLQDIIDKSVGGIVSLSRPAQADRTSFIEDQFEANLTIKDTLRPKKTKTGVSAEPYNERITEYNDLSKNAKPDHVKAFILTALKSNDFVKSLENEQLNQIVECMEKKTAEPKSDIIVEGSVGERIYVLASGKVQILQSNRMIHTLSSENGGIVLGELALLYNCRRTATVRALTTCVLWSIDRHTFRQIMISTNQSQRNMHKMFLRKVSLLKNYSERKVNKIVDAMQVEEFLDGDCITRQGSFGETFYIILDGEVEVSLKQKGFIRTMVGGDYFGEMALLNEAALRTATCTAKGPVRCLTLDRDAFVKLIGNQAERRYDEHKLSTSSNGSAEPTTPIIHTHCMPCMADLRLSDLKPLGTLGVGGFGRVELIKCLRAIPSKGVKLPDSYALKVMRKDHIVETSQEKHIFNERDILFSIDSRWVIKLYRTFRDKVYIFMLLEPCLGGELWTLLRNKVNFDEKWTKFYTACCVEALSYLHSQNIIYRDLKPENLVLSSNGYPKLCDFGFAKKLRPGHKAWTFCGTPEYVPPEIILNKGHDQSADFYALGIFIYELLTGNPPFNSADAMKVYRMALKGLESFSMPLDKISRCSATIIRHLAKEFPSERLGNGRNGVNDIRRHKWFQGFDWDGLAQGSLEAPYTPKIASATDLHNFDVFDDPEDEFLDCESPDDEGWDREF